MMTFDLATDLTWLTYISHRLPRFKKASSASNVFNSRCIVCGDSDRDSKKARCFFYERGFQLNVFCHNCGYSKSFYNFMKDVVPDEFEAYKRDQMLERFKRSSKRSKPEAASSIKETTNDAETPYLKGLDGTVSVSSLDSDHPAVEWLRNRGLGAKEMSRLLYTDNFLVPAQQLSPEPLSANFPTDPRIVIPFYNEEGTIEMVQGRALNNKGLRYISIKANEQVDKVYGKYEADPNKTTYCVEGPFDSLFIDNCLATCDSSLTRIDADVYIWDNEPRNPEIVDLMEQAIDRGLRVVVWPTSPNNKQDVNDMILDGVSRSKLKSIIDSNAVSGPRAKLMLMRWRRV